MRMMSIVAVAGMLAGPALGADEPKLTYSPWTRFCLKPPDANAKQVCFTGKDARNESGQTVVSVVLIESEGTTRKVLRVTVPLEVQLKHGTRIIVDGQRLTTGAYVACHARGCVADYEVNADLVDRFRRSQTLHVQAIDANGRSLTLPIALVDFAKAYDGPPIDPKILEEQQKKLQDELLRRQQDDRLRPEIFKRTLQ